MLKGLLQKITIYIYVVCMCMPAGTLPRYNVLAHLFLEPQINNSLLCMYISTVITSILNKHQVNDMKAGKEVWVHKCECELKQLV